MGRLDGTKDNKMQSMDTLIGSRLFCSCLLLCTLFPAIGSLSLKPPAEEISSAHLCPNPVLSATSKLLPHELSKTQTIRLQPRARSTAYFSRFIRPCTFVDDPTLSPPPRHADGSNATLIRIQAINLNTAQWNFSTASSECSKFVMFRKWSEYGNGYPVMCGRDFEQFQGPFGHPTILYYHLTDNGMSFPLFHPNYESGGLSASLSSASPSERGSRDQPHHKLLELKYMLIYFSIRGPDGKWNCRLQQYDLSSQETCPSAWSSSTTNICGEYKCTDLDELYTKRMGVLRSEAAELQQQRFIVVKSKSQERYRVRNFLRQKFVPIVFLVILICGYKSYMKAGYRLHEHQLPMTVSEGRFRRYSQRHHHHHTRDPFSDIYLDYSSGGSGDDNNGPSGLHIPYEPASPTIGRGITARGRDDMASQAAANKCIYQAPPPAYQDLFPPSYVSLFPSPSPPPPFVASPESNDDNLEVNVVNNVVATSATSLEEGKNPKA